MYTIGAGTLIPMRDLKKVQTACQNPHRALQYAWRNLIRPIRQINRRLSYQSLNVDPLTSVRVNPDDIQRFVFGRRAENGDYHLDACARFRPEDQQWHHGSAVPWGAVQAGDWDKQHMPIEKMAIFQGCYERFCEDVSWENTSFFEAHQQRINQDISTMGYNSIKELRKHTERVDQLYQSIKYDGYQSQKDLGRKLSPHKEIIVNLDRRGNFVFNGQGRHRLAIAKILDLDEIVVSILVRHKRVIYGDSINKI